MVGQDDVNMFVERCLEIFFRIRDNILGNGEVFDGDAAQQLLELVILWHDEQLFDFMWIDDVVLRFFKRDARADRNLFFTLV